LGNTFQLAGGQTKFFFSPSIGSVPPQPLNIGFAIVTSNLPVTGTLLFIAYGPYLTFSLSGPSLSQAAGFAATPLTRQGVLVTRFPGSDGAFAVANPGTATATLTFQVLATNGAPILPPVTRTLAPNNHTSFFFSELFPNAPSVVLGSMRITSDNPVVSVALDFQGNLIATIPIFPLQ
jgi:hypothetical protein